MISFRAPAKNAEDILKPFSFGGNIEIVFHSFCNRHLGSIKGNVSGFTFSVKIHLMRSLMGGKFFF